MIEKKLPRFILFAAASMALLGISGCGRDAGIEFGGKHEAQGAAETKSGEQSNVSLQTADIGAYNALIEKHKGKVVMVDFWATWCPPCRKQFPHTVELAKKYADRGLVAVSVSFDNEDSQDNVLEFLQAQKADFDNLISKYGAGTESMDAFKLDASVPHYRLYDRQGELVYKKDAKPIGIEEKIKELLGQE